MVEYGSLTAGLAALISALAGLVAAPTASLPTVEGRAVALVSSTARKENVTVSGARSVYRHAPYRAPFLRYLFTVGWISGSKNRAACAVDRASGIDPTVDAAKQIRSSAKLRERLRAAHVTVAAASSAVGKGVVSACS